MCAKKLMCAATKVEMFLKSHIKSYIHVPGEIIQLCSLFYGMTTYRFLLWTVDRSTFFVDYYLNADGFAGGNVALTKICDGVGATHGGVLTNFSSAFCPPPRPLLKFLATRDFAVARPAADAIATVPTQLEHVHAQNMKIRYIPLGKDRTVLNWWTHLIWRAESGTIWTLIFRIPCGIQEVMSWMLVSATDWYFVEGCRNSTLKTACSDMTDCG